MNLTEKYRPKSIDDIVGQTHLKHLFEAIVKRGVLMPMIFYGEPGTGKTTTARILANSINQKMTMLNGTSLTTKDVKDAIANSKVLFIDEIQFMDKKKQQLLLPDIESGNIILIATTSSSPYHALNKALVSRCTICQFTQIDNKDILNRLDNIQKQDSDVAKISENIIKAISFQARGDMRSALKLTEMVLNLYPNGDITTEQLKAIIPSDNQSSFDTDAEIHHQLLSAFQKSIRGSDVDASCLYLARLLEGGDIISVVRRLLVIVSEDIGMADSGAVSLVRACCENARELGMPEAKYPLAHATIYLATAQKSNSIGKAMSIAFDDLDKLTRIESHLHVNSLDYKYPHAMPNSYMPEKMQRYRPSYLTKTYYNPRSIEEWKRVGYWENIKNQYKKNNH